MALLTQESVINKIDKLINATNNFPSLIHEAEAMALINRMEKEAILKKYKSVYDKLTTFYLLAGSKGVEYLAKLPELLDLTGNEAAASILLQDEDDNNGSDSKLDLPCQQILDNLEKLCSHTTNPSSVLSFSTGLELINGHERELIAQQCQSEAEQLEAFYGLVASKGTRAVENLIQVLKMTNNFWALEVLHYHDEEDDKDEQ